MIDQVVQQSRSDERHADNEATAAKYHISVTGRPVNVRFGRPGTCTLETIHWQYITMTQGVGMMKARPTSKARLRQVKSHRP